MTPAIGDRSLEGVAHVVQLALTPVFLLSGVAALLNVFSSRLARVADKVDALSGPLDRPGQALGARERRQLAYLRRRSRALDLAVVLGALSGTATCGATLTLFLGAIRNSGAGWLLFALFGAAVLFIMGALGAFCYEMLLASRGLRTRAAHAAHDDGGADTSDPSTEDDSEPAPTPAPTLSPP